MSAIEHRAIAAAEALRAYRVTLAAAVVYEDSPIDTALRQEEARQELQLLAATLRDAGLDARSVENILLLVAGEPLAGAVEDLVIFERLCRGYAAESLDEKDVGHG